MAEAYELRRLRRTAADGLKRAASAFEEAASAPVSTVAPGTRPPGALPSAEHDAADAVRSMRLGLDNELAVQELVNLLLPAIENALRNRRDIGAP